MEKPEENLMREITQNSLFDLPPPIPVDITAGRHRNNPESRAANPSLASKRASHERILTLLRERGTTWLHQVCRILNKSPNEVSPRLSEMKQMKLIEPTGARIEKCAVLRLIK